MEVPVLLPKVFNHPFTYINSTQKIKNLTTGDVVIVPFGQKKEVGVIWDKIRNTKKKIKLKQIEKKIPNVSLNKKMIKFINWFSSYNLTFLMWKCRAVSYNGRPYSNCFESIPN